MKDVVLIDEVINLKQRMRDALFMAGFTATEAKKLADLRVIHVLDPKRRM